jgi:hypothetical protein
MDFSYLFSHGKSGGPGPRRVDQAAQLRSTVDEDGVDKRELWHLAGVRCAGAEARWYSPAAVEEDEPDEAVPEGCSPEHVRRRRGGAMKVKNGDGFSSA